MAAGIFITFSLSLSLYAPSGNFLVTLNSLIIARTSIYNKTSDAVTGWYFGSGRES